MLSQRGELPPIRKSMVRSQLSQPKQKKQFKLGQYIDDSLKKIQNGCYENGKLCIDGGYGDYRMSIFRLKDRKRRFNQIPTMFTPSFIKDVEQISPELKQQFHKIIKSSNQNYLKKDNQDEDPQSQGPKLPEWNDEEQGYLYHQYVPDYQKQRWFKKTIPQIRKEQQKIEAVKVVVKQVKKKRRKNEKTHFFRFMDSNSMVFINSS